jgi:uncharacterized membrane protein
MPPAPRKRLFPVVLLLWALRRCGHLRACAKMPTVMEVIMDLAHLHLMLNHIPVIGVGFGFAVLLVGTVARSRGITGVGLGLLVFSALIAIPVYLTGESAEEIVEKFPGVSESITDQHQSAAAWSLGLVIASGVFAIGAAVYTFLRKAGRPNILVIATLLMTLVTASSMVRTANLGGQIRHTEIRADGTVINTDTGTDRKGGDKDDDD